LRARAGFVTGPRLYVEFVRWALMLVSLVADARVGLPLIAITSIAPTLVFAGLPLQPRDRWLSLVLRVPLDVIAWLRACVQPDPRAEAIEAARPLYRSMASDDAPLFSPRRERCPLCGSAELRPHLTTTDLVQRKPGRFSLERCAGCELIFQNPPLSSRGLAYYYRDFYDGLNADVMDEVFTSTHRLYTSRIEALTLNGSAPRRWLDLGCGYGHFSLAAKRVLPATRFEGLDQSDSVEMAEKRGWIDRAWKMSSAELAAAGETFDLVSLFHYLEHTQDPAKEIALAAQLVAPGGRVVIEIPNPRCRLGRVLGRWWFPWFQPQHQLFLDETWVRRLLATAGMQTTSVTYLMTAGDVLLSSLLAVRNACSPGDAPWVRKPTPTRIAVDLLIWAAALPLFVFAIACDAIYSLLPASPQNSNAFRVVATRPEH
jgi:2-polyprenyl-3-methyl-5-hydroxy-6-metoxy-1,4-benzoquinol methylase